MMHAEVGVKTVGFPFRNMQPGIVRVVCKKEPTDFVTASNGVIEALPKLGLGLGFTNQYGYGSIVRNGRRDCVRYTTNTPGNFTLRILVETQKVVTLS